jgi:cysteine desulfurase/selenocysteine lyase
MAFDLERLRADTPATARLAYFYNCGAGLMPQPVLNAVKAHLDLETQIGGYEAEDAAAGAIENTYGALARMLNCATDEIAIVENATVAWCQAFYGLAQDMAPGDRVLTVVAEYASNYIALLQTARRRGIRIDVVPNTADGETDVAALEAMIDDKVKLIAVTHVPTSGGLVNPAAEIGRVAKRHGIPYLLDACQSAGQMPLDVEALGCDFLSATGRKFLRGPRGTGFLYVRRAMLETTEPPVLDLHSAAWTGPDSYEMRKDARRYENWENYVAGKIGLGVAVDYALDIGLETIWSRIQDLCEPLRDRLAALPDVRVHDAGRIRAAIVTFAHDRLTPSEMQRRLAAQNIAIGTSSASSTLLDFEARHLPPLARAAPHYYTSEAEIDRLVEAIGAL